MQFEVPFEIIKYILCKYFIVIEISLPVKKKAFFFSNRRIKIIRFRRNFFTLYNIHIVCRFSLDFIILVSH